MIRVNAKSAKSPRLVALDAADRRWEKYHGWYDLAGECFVRVLGPQGGSRWTWYPPIPVPYRPAAGADGTVFVAGPGRLWALGA